MKQPARPDDFARVHGSPGAEPRLAGLGRAVGPLLLAGVAAGYLIRAAWPVPALAPWAAGTLLLLLALGLAAYVAAARHRMERYLKGARGEESIARELAFLPAPYRVYHGAADCDHVVIGPGAVFAIETKNWSGRVTVVENRVLLDGQAPERPPLDQVRRAAAALEKALTAHCGKVLPVIPVLSFASDSLAEPSLSTGGVIVCRGEALAGLLRDRRDLPLDEPTRLLAAEYLEGTLV